MIRNLNLFLAVSCSLMIGACQQTVDENLESETLQMSIQANIGTPKLLSGRYAGSTPDAVNFAENDQIGLFIKEVAPLKWTYSQSVWNTENLVYWENKTEAFDFSAFYPYAEGATYEVVPMPSLAQQVGTMADVAAHDFLIATTNQSYGLDGVVKFTDDHSFKHVSALIQLTMDGTGDLKGATLKDITLQGKDIVAETQYSFATKQTTLKSSVEAEAGGKLVATLADETLSGQKVYYLLVNAVESTGVINLSVSYESGGSTYKTPGVQLPVEKFVGGTRYAFKLSIRDAHLKISDAQIAPWTDGGHFDDIVMDGTEVK